MKKLLTFVIGAAAVAGAAYWAAKYLAGCEKPESIYPDAQPQDAPEQDGVSAPAEAEAVEHPAEPDGENVSVKQRPRSDGTGGAAILRSLFHIWPAGHYAIARLTGG